MSKGNTTEADIIAFVFNATAMPAYGANLVVTLHTADPGEAGTLATNECDYDGSRAGRSTVRAGGAA